MSRCPHGYELEDLRTGASVCEKCSETHRPPEPVLGGADRDTLWCLWLHGPTWDGDVPSKSARDELVRLGLAARGDGYQWLTDAGARLCLRLGMASRKERRDRERRGELSRLEAHNAELRRLLDAKVRIITDKVQRTGEYDG